MSSSKIFDANLAQELYSQSLSQTEIPTAELIASFDLSDFTYEINRRDVLNMLESKFCHLGNVFYGDNKGTEVSFAPSGATIQSIHIARLDKNQNIVKSVGADGKVTIVMDEYNNLMLPVLSLEEGPDSGVQYQFGRVNASATGSYQNLAARKENFAGVNPTNIYATKLNFRQLGMKNCGFNVQEIIYIDFDAGKGKIINLNVEVFYNWDTKALEVTARGLNYINKTLLSHNVAQSSVYSQADVTIQQAIRKADNVLLDANKNKAYKEQMAEYSKQLLAQISGTTDMEDVVMYEEEDDSMDTPVAPVKKIIKIKKVSKLTTGQVGKLNRAFQQGQSLASITKEQSLSHNTVGKYYKMWKENNPSNTVTVDVNP